jgi:hypothetical protein
MGVTSQREILAHVCFLDPIIAMDRGRRDIAREAYDAIFLTLFPQAQHSYLTPDHADSREPIIQA